MIQSMLLLSAVLGQPDDPLPYNYPRIACLWGVTPDSMEYDRWAKYDLLIMSGGDIESWRRFRTEVRRRNPAILMLATLSFTNVYEKPGTSDWLTPEMYLRAPDGKVLSWWADQIYASNILKDVYLDAWLEYIDWSIGPAVREGLIDGFFFDSVVGSISLMFPEIDADEDGRADDPLPLNEQWRRRQCVFFDRLHEKWPNMLTLANDVDLFHAPHLNGRLFESQRLLDMALTGAAHPAQIIQHLDQWTSTTRQPSITMALTGHVIGWETWRVGQGKEVLLPGENEAGRRDFRRMRLGFLLTLLTDAYYSYDMGTTLYGLDWFYPDYRMPVGRPLGPHEEVFTGEGRPCFQWRAGDAESPFELSAVSCLTPEGVQADVGDPSQTWQALFHTRSGHIRFTPDKVYRVQAACDILRPSCGNFQFVARTPSGSGPYAINYMVPERDLRPHDKGVYLHIGVTGPRWNMLATFIPDAFDDYRLEWHVRGGGALRLTSLTVTEYDGVYYRRRFENGTVLLNGSNHPVPVSLDEPMCYPEGNPAPRHQMLIDDDTPAFAVSPDGWKPDILNRRKYGPSCQVTEDGGSEATWRFRVPEEGRYRAYAFIPEQDGMTASARYTLRGECELADVTIDQTQGHSAWVDLFEEGLTPGTEYTLALRSTEAGKRTVADAILVESARPYYPPTTEPVTHIVLPPLDGLVLLSAPQ